MNKSNKTKSIVFIVLFMNTIYGIAQQNLPAPLGQNIVGINASYHFLPERGPFMFGASYERGFSRHSGIETGVYSHSAKTTNQIQHNDKLYTVSYRSYYLNIPVLYKYYSRVVNVAAGPAINIFTGWKQINSSEAKLTSVEESPRVRLGYQIKVGKSFEPFENIIIEPEARLISLKHLDLSTNVIATGLGVGLKYRL